MLLLFKGLRPPSAEVFKTKQSEYKLTLAAGMALQHVISHEISK